MKKQRIIKAEIVLSLYLWLMTALSASAFYNPTAGKWLSRDSLAERSTKSLYALVDNHPTCDFDIDGKQAAGMIAGPPNVPPHKWEDLPKSDPRACKYGSIKFAADFLISVGCRPLLMVPPTRWNPCVKRFAWPVDCVCKGMSDSPIDQCIRGCLFAKNDKGGFPDMSEHLACVRSCSATPADAADVIARLYLTIQSCAIREGCYVGGGGKLPGEYSGPCVTPSICCGILCPLVPLF